MNYEKSEYELARLRSSQKELVERIGRAVPEDGTLQMLPGLFLQRASDLTPRGHGVSDLSMCIIAQGSKEVLLGDYLYRYDSAHYLLGTVQLPIVFEVLEASKERPYLSLRLQLDPDLVGSVIVESRLPAARKQGDVKGINVSRLDAKLLDAVVRLVRLIEAPNEADFLAPLIIREIVYRLLLGEQGERLRLVAGLGGQFHRVIKVIDRLRKDYDKPLRIEEIAQDSGMSTSSFHQHFKAVTAMSPLQFQKQLRLQEARRLILSEKLDAASAGFRVGYDDPSHFSREYKSLFGNPPVRDTEHLRGVFGQAN